jgi:hypothetical protein
MKPLFALAIASCLAQAGCPTPPLPKPAPPDANDAAPAPPPPQPPSYDGSTTSTCYKACQALHTAGCAEGDAVNCIVRLQSINDLRTQKNLANQGKALTCDDLAAVKTASDVTRTGQPCSPSSSK